MRLLTSLIRRPGKTDVQRGYTYKRDLPGGTAVVDHDGVATDNGIAALALLRERIVVPVAEAELLHGSAGYRPQLSAAQLSSPACHPERSEGS